MPKSVDDVIGGALMHAAYDPTKAHEYYMRTRNLKGRKKGAQVIPIGQKGGHKPPPPPSHKVPAELESKIHHLEARLNELRDHLRKLLASKRKSAHGPSHQTQQEKQKKAAANKQYQQQHKSQIAQKRKQAHGGGSGGGSTPISSMTEKQLKEAISKTSQSLHAAVAKARAVANRGTA